MSGTGRGGRAALLVLIGAMTALGPLGTDLYLPGLPAVTTEFDAGGSASQLTLMAFLLGVGLGHFLWGPVCDRFGRRGPLLLGLGIFALAGAACAIAPSIETLLLARLVQGIAGSAGIVISRAIVRDLYEGAELRRIFGMIAILFGVFPIVGPLIGAGIMQFAGWRGTFWGLAILGLVFLVLSAVLLPETLEPARRVHGRDAGRAEAWLAPLRHPVFLTNAALLMLSSVVMFSYVAYVPFILQVERGIDDVGFATLFAINAIAVLVGGQFAAILARRVAGRRVVSTAYGIALIATLLILATIAFDWPVWTLMVGLWVMTLQIAIIQPTALGLALEPFARGAGVATAIIGGAQFLGAATIAGAISAVFGSAGIVLGITLVTVISLALLVSLIGPALLGRRVGERPA